MDKRFPLRLAVLGFLLLIVLVPAPSGFAEPRGKLVIFHAGSLSMPLQAVAKGFEAKYPQVQVLREAAGSQQCVRKIIDLHKPCDIMASADYAVIDKLLIPQYADWNIRFASNQMVLCFTDKSQLAQEVTPDNWYDILAKKGVVWGHSDPNLDPCGYRALMVLQLAEKYYKRPGLYEKAVANRPAANIRPKSVELIALLQTGNMDYAWEYLSIATQHGLKYLTLPDEINLGNYQYDKDYSQAVVKVTGKEPGAFMDMKGKSITYGITLIKNAPNREAALAFLQYLLSPDGGLKVLKDMGQPPFRPARVPTAKMKESLPGELQGLVEVKN